ncbi:hypothetical protein EDB94_3756 [Marinobacter sp. 3-2]|jgi:hypothetical protein|uniref:hypothetical protein n=1 Tax=Marinobacter sp. 3-2 TaxID=2485141 RepID=UPI000D35A4BC|nr:hypothetical protein [Marinobacter sp. 3-2]ROQ39353.1 hypothetical protein EDB94_3756 [Marinobacter sp. 3-2]
MKMLTLTEEEMIENLHLATEEVLLQCMVLNRRGIVQAHLNIHGHTQSTDIRIMPANTEWRDEIELPDKLAEIDIRLTFYDGLNKNEMNDEYLARMASLEQFIRYLDHLIALNKPIEVELKETAA